MATISQTIFSHKGTIMWKIREITNGRLFTFKIIYFASLVQLLTWILMHVLAFHPLERLWWSLAWISSLPMGLSPSYLFWWQLMWWVTTDVAVSVCGRSGLWPFRFVAVPVCGRFGLWPFWFVAVSVCGRFGCGRFGLWRLWHVTRYRWNAVFLEFTYHILLRPSEMKRHTHNYLN